MAVVVNKLNGFTMPLYMEREQPQPLDKSSIWGNYNEALAYAKTDPVAYFGQTISVYNSTDKSQNGIYRINTDNNNNTILTLLADLDEIESIIEEKILEINTGLSNAGYQGSYVALKSKETFTKGMVFNILESEINDFLNDFEVSNIEAGDWLIIKKEIPFQNLNKDNFDEYIGVWEKNLTGAATTVTQLTNTESSPDYFISSVTKENTSSEIKVTKSQLPVKGIGENKQVDIESTTNIVTGIKLEDNKIVPEVINVNDLNLGNPLQQIYRVPKLYDNITVTDESSTEKLNDIIIIPIPNQYNINKKTNDNVLMYQNGVFVSTTSLFYLRPLSEVKNIIYRSNGVEIDFSNCEWLVELRSVSSREVPIDTDDTIDLIFTYLG